MEIISLLVKTRRGVAVNQTQLIDIDDIAAPLTETNAGADTAFSLREGKKGPFASQNTGTFIEPYTVDQTLSQIQALAVSIFVVNVISYKGRTLTGSPLMGFNAKFIAGYIKPNGTGSEFMYQEDSDPDLVKYVVSQNPAAILAQITGAIPASGWALDGNTNSALKYIGTNDNFPFPVRVNGTERFRFLTNGTIQYPLNAVNGYVLTSDGTGIGTWQPAPGISPVTNGFEPVISQINTPPVSPVTGDRYLISAGGTGAWAGHDTSIAEWNGTTWIFTVPASGDYVYVINTLTTYQFNGTIWQPVPGIAILQNGNTLGTTMRIGTVDAKNFQFLTTGTIRMRLSAAGDLNVVNNTYFGHASATSTSKIFVLGTADVPQVIIQANTVQNISNPFIKFLKSDGTELMRINSDTYVNTFMGFESGISNDYLGGGVDNTFYGNSSGRFNTIGTLNSYFGKRAGESNIDGNMVTAMGAGASQQNVHGSKIVAIGWHAAVSSQGSNLVILGAEAFTAATTANNAVIIGTTAGSVITTANNITAVGYQSAISLTTGSNNSYYGSQAGYLAVDGGLNTHIGMQSGYSNVHGNYSTYLGHTAGYSTTGDFGVYIGYSAGYFETGSNKLFIDTYNRSNEATGRIQSLIYGIFAGTPAGQTLSFNAQTINMPYLQTGNAGLTTGMLYVDTAANILANSDKVVGWKN